MKHILFHLFLILSIVSCKTFNKKSEEATVSRTRTEQDDIFSHIDTTVSPGEDFFLFVNGNWLKNNPVPASEADWGIGDLVREEIYIRLKKINEDAAKKKHKAGSRDQKIADFWRTAMDTVKLDSLGLSPLRSELNAISAIKNVNDLFRVAADLQTKGVNVFYNNFVYNDDMNSAVMAFFIWQGGLGMPNRDYYINSDERTRKVREAYNTYLEKTFANLGSDSATARKQAADVLALEKRLAQSSRPLADLRDPELNYNKMPVQALYKNAPDILWKEYLRKIGMKLDTVIVGQPEYLAALNREIKKTNIETWKNYLRIHLVKTYAPYLDKRSFDDLFAYNSKLTGATEPRPRWKRVLDAEEAAIGEALGQIFVKEYFNERAKQRYTDMVENVRAAYKDRILALDWMSDSTKMKAIRKLSKIRQRVGYPDKWKDFSSLKISTDSYAGNVKRGNQWWHFYEVNKLGKPVDRDEWDMSPQTYNAYYSPSNNEIVLPAGIFTIPGYRDEEIDEAIVYGYAGASTIGHEITHGFDDQGAKYDENGNLKNWWSLKDSIEFAKRGLLIVQQFKEFMPVDSLRINGEATQGENIADLGGLLIGLDAFKRTETYKKGELVNGYTPLQRFFIGYALGWMYNVKPERLANLVLTDYHAPPKERVNGPMVNIPEFYEAFNIKPGDKMYRPDSLRVKIW